MTRPLLALLFAALAPAAPVPKVKPKGGIHPTAVGTRWEYIRGGDENKVYVEEVTEAEEKDGVTTFRIDMTTDTGAVRSTTYTAGNGELRVPGGLGRKYEPSSLLRTAAMKDGDTWTDKYSMNGADYEVAVSVGKAEEVTTPAGKFTATPITRKWVKPQSPGETVWWFNDEVGLVRQTADGKPAQELKAFTPGKGTK